MSTEWRIFRETLEDGEVWAVADGTFVAYFLTLQEALDWVAVEANQDRSTRR